MRYMVAPTVAVAVFVGVGVGLLRGRLRTVAAIATAASVKLWKRATSLGGVESLIEHRGSVEGPPCPTDLLRLSVGLEHPDDLFSDLDYAIRAAHGAAA